MDVVPEVARRGARRHRAAVLRGRRRRRGDGAGRALPGRRGHGVLVGPGHRGPARHGGRSRRRQRGRDDRAARGRPGGVGRLYRPRHAADGAGAGAPTIRPRSPRGRSRRARATRRACTSVGCTTRSADGTRVHMFVVAPAAAPDRPRPTVLYGYGGFDIALTPAYTPSMLAWVEAGGVWAVANLRGGSENGEDWHRDGMREHKQNVFDDFAAAAERAGRATAGRRRRSSASTAARTAACSSAPRSPSGPSSTRRSSAARRCWTWSATSCSASAAPGTTSTARRRTRSSSAGCWRTRPYHHVRDGVDYPAVLFTTFDSDTRVDPLHARKMCAALQHATVRDAAGAAAPGEATSVTAPARSAGPCSCRSTSSPSSPTGWGCRCDRDQDAVDRGPVLRRVRRGQPRGDRRQADPHRC